MTDSKPFDKSRALDFLIEHLRSEIERINEGYEHARHTSIDAPGRMASRYDTMGVEAAWRADGLKKNIVEKERAVAYLEALRNKEIGDRVEVGAAVGIGPKEGTVELYFLVLPAAGGITIPLEGVSEEVLSVTVEAPVARALVGHKLGDLVNARPAAEFMDEVKVVF